MYEPFHRARTLNPLRFKRQVPIKHDFSLYRKLASELVFSDGPSLTSSLHTAQVHGRESHPEAGAVADRESMDGEEEAPVELNRVPSQGRHDNDGMWPTCAELAAQPNEEPYRHAIQLNQITATPAQQGSETPYQNQLRADPAIDPALSPPPPSLLADVGIRTTDGDRRYKVMKGPWSHSVVTLQKAREIGAPLRRELPAHPDYVRSVALFQPKLWTYLRIDPLIDGCQPTWQPFKVWEGAMPKTDVGIFLRTKPLPPLPTAAPRRGYSNPRPGIPQIVVDYHNGGEPHHHGIEVPGRDTDAIMIDQPVDPSVNPGPVLSQTAIRMDHSNGPSRTRLGPVVSPDAVQPTTLSIDTNSTLSQADTLITGDGVMPSTAPTSHGSTHWKPNYNGGGGSTYTQRFPDAYSDEI